MTNSGNREREVAETFVSLSTRLAEGADVLELMSELTSDCARLLDVASAGLLLADRHQVLQVLAASSEETRALEVFQLQSEQGPCLDCYHSQSAVKVESLIREAARWPQFAEAALNAGFRSVHALPMRQDGTVLGALGLFGTTPGPLNDADLRLAQAFADVASVALTQSPASQARGTIHHQLQAALDYRAALDQAKGIMAQVGGLSMDVALAYLRRYSRDHNRRLNDLADDLVSRRLPAIQVLKHVRAAHQPRQE